MERLTNLSKFERKQASSRDDVGFCPSIRRRCGSLSRAEHIVTEEEKVRRARPDKPVHRPKDSLFSWRSGFHNFEGVINWAFLMLSIGGLRLALENLNKYGIRVDPKRWFFFLLGAGDGGSHKYPTLFMIMFANVHLLFAFALEKMAVTRSISDFVCRALHGVNLMGILFVPVYVINTQYEDIGPGMEGVFATVTFIYVILFLKLYSYMCTMQWLRTDYFRQGSSKRLRKDRTTQVCATLVSRRKREERSCIEHFTNLSRVSDVHSPDCSNFSQAIAAIVSPPKEIKKLTESLTSRLVHYPNNLNLKDLYYFWFAPTLCYELNFPRSSRRRKCFLFRRLMEVIIGTNLFFCLVQQWIIPCVVNSLLPFSNMKWSHATERLLKLSVPNHLIWLTLFYLLFHSVLNTVGELMRFADRKFYSDWWNANNVHEFWKMWNLPVHNWCVRHVYKPLQNEWNMTKFQSLVFVFVLSATLHEYLVSVPLRMFKAYAFAGMVLQIPLIYITAAIQRKWGSRCGNLMVWLSLIIGQPLAVMMYYHDFVVEHYGQELLQTFGKIHSVDSLP